MRGFLFVLVLTVVVPSCQLPSMGQGRLQSIEANLGSLRKVQGRLGDSPFTAYFQQMDLQMVEESPVEGGPVRNRYYYHQNVLFYYRQYRGNDLQSQFSIDKRGAAGNLVPASFGDGERKTAMARAENLNKVAFERAGQMFVFPLMRNR